MKLSPAILAESDRSRELNAPLAEEVGQALEALDRGEGRRPRFLVCIGHIFNLD